MSVPSLLVRLAVAGGSFTQWVDLALFLECHMSTIGPIVRGERQLATVDIVDRPGQVYTYPAFSDIQNVYQSKPRSWSPLPYNRRIREMKIQRADHWIYGFAGDDGIDLCRLDSVANRCAQKAYGKLVGQIKDVQAGWGETLATRKQTFETIIFRLTTLTNAARCLKRGDISGFASALGTTAKKTKSRLKKASNLWLEYHFGWEPLYQDIYDSCRKLGESLPWGRVSASSSEDVTVTGSRPGPNLYGNYRAEGRCVVKLSGLYYVDSPGLYLFNSLGIINPVSVAWELVPFSFAVDWFIPVGQYLAGLTDFVGVNRKDEFTTVYQTGKSNSWFADSLYSTKSMRVKRTLGITIPKPTWKLYRGFSVVRGVTAISLLTGMLKSLG